jgi:hypothetical protein
VSLTIKFKSDKLAPPSLVDIDQEGVVWLPAQAEGAELLVTPTQDQGIEIRVVLSLPNGRFSNASLAEPAVRMATLLSALPQKDRLNARAELVGQVARRQRQGPRSRSLYPQDSVIRHEIERIADQLAGAFRATPSHQEAALWGDFAVALNNHLALIEFTAEGVIAEFSQE